MNEIKALQEAKELIAKLRGELKETNTVLLTISESARQTNGNFADIRLPKELQKSLEANKAVIEQLNAFTKERSRLEKALKDSIAKRSLAESKINKELIKNREETRLLNKNLKDQAILSSKVAGAYLKLSVRHKIAANTLKNYIAEGKRANETQKQFNARLKKSQREFDILDAKIKKADAAARDFRRNVGNYPKGLKNLAGVARNLAGAFGFTSGIYLFAGAIKDAFKRVREFDKSMQNLAGVLRTSRSEIADVEAEVIKVAGASIKTSREVATLAESLATLGKRGQDLINLIKPANDLSIALGATSDEAAEFLVQNLNAFGDSSDYAAEYADVIAAIRTSTSLDFQKMRDSFQYLTPISRILGKDLAYTGGIIGVLADNSIKAEQGARLLGTAQQKLAKDGVSLNDALDQINKAQEEGAEGLELLALASGLFGKQAAKIGIVLASNREKIDEYAESIRGSKGALDDLVNEQLKSLDSQLKIMDSTWERLILTVENGEGSFARAFKDVTLGVTGYLEELIRVEEAQSRVFDATGLEEGSRRGQRTLFALTMGLVNIKTEYDDLVELQSEFNRYLGEMGSNTDISFLQDELSRLNEILTERNGLSEDEIKLYIEQRNRVEGLLNTNIKNREELKKQAFQIVKTTGKFDDFGKKIDILSNDILRDFIRANKDVAKSLGAINEEFDNQDFETLEKLGEKLKALKDRYEQVDVNGDEFKQLKKEIAALEAYISKLTGKGKKAAERIIKGSIGYFENLISQEKKFQKNEALTREEIIASDEKIEEYKKEIEKLTGAYIKLSKVQVVINPLGSLNDQAEQAEKEAKRIRQILEGTVARKTIGYDVESNGNPNPIFDDTTIAFGTDALEVPDTDEVVAALQKIVDKYSDVTKASKISAEEQSEIFGQLFSTFANYYGLDLQAFQNILFSKEASIEDYANAAKSVTNAIFESQLIKYDNEIVANQERLDRILNDENISDEKKKQAKIEAEEQEKKIRLKQAKAERTNTLIQIGIDTAAAVTKILLTAAALSSNPLTAPFAANAYAQAAIAGALGAAQAAFVASQPLPKFEKGTKNAPKGLAWTNEKGAEIHTDKFGNVKDFGTNDGATLKYLEQGDKIYNANDSKKILAAHQESEAERIDMAIIRMNFNAMNGLKKEIKSGIKDGFKGVKVVNHNKIINKTESSRYH